MNEKPITSFEHLGMALQTLEEALEIPVTHKIIMDGTIQRFEFTIELYWKALKRLLEELGYPTLSPKQTLQKAYAAGLIDDEKLWLGMLNDRNETSHIYNEAQAKEIYEHIRHYYPKMQKTYDSLKQRYFDGK